MTLLRSPGEKYAACDNIQREVNPIKPSALQARYVASRLQIQLPIRSQVRCQSEHNLGGKLGRKLGGKLGGILGGKLGGK